jgi:glycosyltransferase involved in cell wall biosynthesis
VCKAPRVSLGPPSSRDRLSVAVDATPLLGTRTGVGMYCLGVLEALAARTDLETAAYAVTWRRRHLLGPLVPAHIRVVQRAMPARPLHRIWSRMSVPPIEWFTGPSDVVHGTNFVVPPTHRAARVVTVHDLTGVHYPEMCDPPSLVFPRIVRRAVAEGAWVHTLSQFVADEVVAEFGADPDRVRVVAPGIPEHSSWSPPPIGEKGEEGEKGETPWPDVVPRPAGVDRYVLAVSTAEPRKDLPGLVRAFDRLAAEVSDVALVLAGAPGWGEEALEEALAASVWRNRIVRLGYVDDAAIGQVFTGASILAYPSVYEGFGFPPLEAMVAGVPVVATAVGAVPEIAGDGAQLVTPGDTDALASALAHVLDDDVARKALIERGFARAALFTWKACGEGLAHLYDDAAASR